MNDINAINALPTVECDNVIIVDADFADRVAFDLIVNFERMLGRRIPNADMALWLECLALDGGVREGAQQTQVVKVNGENGARAYQIGANSSAILLDESGTMIWLCTTDGAGYKTVTAYDISPHQTAPAPDYSTLEERIKKLEGFMHELTADSSAAPEK